MQMSGSFVFDWPLSWESAEHLRWLEGSAFQTLLFRASQPGALRASAEARGFRCVVEEQGGFRWRAHGEMDWANPGPCVAVNDAFWPSIAIAKASNDSADAGPTGSPWLDANGWLILLARARAKGKDVWIRAKEPEKPESLEPSSYRIALAEACAYGAVRPVWLTPRHAAEVAAGQASWWKDLCADAAWWNSRAAWRSWPVSARLAIVSDYAGANEFLATETLLLAARRNLAYTPVPKADCGPRSLQGKKAVLWLDPEDAPEWAEAFVRAGGLLICRKTKLRGQARPEQHDRFQFMALGAGRIAVATKDWDDPWVLAQDVHLLVSRRWDPVRVFNAGLLQHHVVESADGRSQLIHMMNYTMRPSWNLVTLAPAAKVRSARTHLPGSSTPAALEVKPVSGRQELVLPRFPIAMTVELELHRDA